MKQETMKITKITNGIIAITKITDSDTDIDSDTETDSVLIKKETIPLGIAKKKISLTLSPECHSLGNIHQDSPYSN